MGKTLEVHLAKPGGKREGPFTLEEINLALTSDKYRSGDYWAWHEGLPEWVPLYEIKGLIKVSTSDAGPQPKPTEASTNSTPDEGPASHAANDQVPEPDKSPGRTTDFKSEEQTEKAPVATAAEQERDDETKQREFPVEGAEPGDEPECQPITSEEPPPKANTEPSAIAQEHTQEIPVNFTETEAEVAEGECADNTISADQPVEPPVHIEEEQPVNDFCEAESSEGHSCEDAGDSGSEATTEGLMPDGQTEFSKTEANDLVARTETAAAILARLKESLCQKNKGASVAPTSGDCFRDLPAPTNEATSFFNAESVRMPGLTAQPIIPSDTGASGSELAEAGVGFETVSHDFQSTAVPRPPGATPGDAENAEVKRLAERFSSGMPFEALEQIFIFTTGDASVWNSPVVMLMLEAIVGEKQEVIRRSTPRDVIFNCDLSQLLKRDGAISDAVWRAMGIREPSVIARAQQKLSHTCVRTFQIDTSTVAALILFYNVQKLPPDAHPSLTPISCPGPIFATSPGSFHPR